MAITSNTCIISRGPTCLLLAEYLAKAVTLPHGVGGGFVYRAWLVEELLVIGVVVALWTVLVDVGNDVV